MLQSSTHMLSAELDRVVCAPTVVILQVKCVKTVLETVVSIDVPELVGSKPCVPWEESGPRRFPAVLNCQAQLLAANHSPVSMCCQ